MTSLIQIQVTMELYASYVVTNPGNFFSQLFPGTGSDGYSYHVSNVTVTQGRETVALTFSGHDSVTVGKDDVRSDYAGLYCVINDIVIVTFSIQGWVPITIDGSVLYDPDTEQSVITGYPSQGYFPPIYTYYGAADISGDFESGVIPPAWWVNPSSSYNNIVSGKLQYPQLNSAVENNPNQGVYFAFTDTFDIEFDLGHISGKPDADGKIWFDFHTSTYPSSEDWYRVEVIVYDGYLKITDTDYVGSSPTNVHYVETTSDGTIKIRIVYTPTTREVYYYVGSSWTLLYTKGGPSTIVWMGITGFQGIYIDAISMADPDGAQYVVESTDGDGGFAFVTFPLLNGAGIGTRYLGSSQGHMALPMFSIGAYQSDNDRANLDIPMLTISGEARSIYCDISIPILTCNGGNIVNWAEFNWVSLEADGTITYAYGGDFIHLTEEGLSFFQGAPNDIVDSIKPTILIKDHPDMIELAEALFGSL